MISSREGVIRLAGALCLLDGWIPKKVCAGAYFFRKSRQTIISIVISNRIITTHRLNMIDGHLRVLNTNYNPTDRNPDIVIIDTRHMLFASRDDERASGSTILDSYGHVLLTIPAFLKWNVDYKKAVVLIPRQLLPPKSMRRRILFVTFPRTSHDMIC